MVRFPKLIILALTALAAGLCATLNAQVLNTTDVSPDAPFGTPQDSNGVDPSGRILQVLVNPSSDSILYAASEFSGVWVSVDAGKSWQQRSIGLRSGYTGGVGPYLAISSLDTAKLLYVTDAGDGRNSHPYGGLWVSINGAADWHHVDPCGKTDLNTSGSNTYSVVFAQGQPFVATDCGIVTSEESDLTDPSGWHPISGSLPFAAANTEVAARASSLTLFACQGNQVWRGTSPLSSSPVWQSVNLPGSCGGQFGGQMAVVPQTGFELEPSSVLVVCSLSSGGLEVERVDFDAASPNQVTALNFAAVAGTNGSGTVGAFVAPFANPFGSGPGESFDIYAADGCALFRFEASTSNWFMLQAGSSSYAGATPSQRSCSKGTTGIHVDTWSMAFPSTYDPRHANCTAYASTDGGVFVNQSLSPLGCDRTSGWVSAFSGLHVYASEAMAGLSRASSDCGGLPTPCPILYDPAADDEVWVRAVGGLPGSSWQDLQANTGDAAQVLVDPALPTQVVTARLNNIMSLQQSTDGKPLAADNATGARNIAPPDFASAAGNQTQGPNASIAQTPHVGAVSQVMTLPSESPLPFGDYFAVTSPFSNNDCKNAPSGCFDGIVRYVPVGPFASWLDVERFHLFGPGWISQIVTSGGHANPTIYVLTANNPNISLIPIGKGKVYKGQVGADGKVDAWAQSSGQFGQSLNAAYNLFVNPYDPSELYATDIGDANIKTSRDGGQTWTAEPSLTSIATNLNEFAFGCGQFAWGNLPAEKFFQAACSLTDVNFVRDHPEIRVAALFPGGVAFSRDYGHHWLALDVTNAQPFGNPPTYDLIEMPTAVFYDPQLNPATGQPSIYIAIQGKGVKQVDGPFPTLISAQVVFCTACEAGGGSIAGDAVVKIFVGALGTSVPLHLGSDGLFHGNVLFDSAKITSFDYHFEVNGKPTRSFRANLTPAEIASGVTTLTNARPPRFRGEIESHSQQTPGVVNVGFELTEAGEGAAQNVQITGVSFNTVRGKGNVSLDPTTAALVPILFGNLAEGGSQTVPFVLDVPASVEKFRMTISGTAQDAIGRSFPFEIRKSLGPRGDRNEGDSRKN
jgi:hypothetical protein